MNELKIDMDNINEIENAKEDNVSSKWDMYSRHKVMSKIAEYLLEPEEQKDDFYEK